MFSSAIRTSGRGAIAAPLVASASRSAVSATGSSTSAVAAAVTAQRQFSATAAAAAKVVCVLYPDPTTGYPPEYARDDIPEIKQYPDGQTTPTPQAIDFTPGELLGCVSGELGLREYLESNGHTFVVTTDKDGEGSELDRELADADVVISQPFYPAYITRQRLENSPNLKLAITAGIGSDHVDLEAAADHKVDVAEITFCNSISVAEHVVMHILTLVRNFVPSHKIYTEGGWHIADCVQRAYDVEGMSVGTVAAGRIGYAVLKRMKAFDCELHYTDRHRLTPEQEAELNLTYHETVEDMVKVCDVVTINCPLHPETEHLFDAEMIGKMKRGSYLVNTARGKICDRDAVAAAVENGQLAGYAGDVSFPQPPEPNHPWRSLKWSAMTPHTSGTTLSAQARYAAGVREVLEKFFAGQEQRDEYQILTNGKLAGVGAHSYSEGNATDGSAAAAEFKH